MAEEKEIQNDTIMGLCTSIFKSGATTTKEIYTEKWAEMINTLERSKST